MTSRPGPASRSTTERWVTIATAAIENLRPDELARELDADERDVLVVDVRGGEERQSGVIAGSIGVARGEVEQSLGAMCDLTQRIVVYCDDGTRSALAAAALYGLGFEDVAHLAGGLAAWTSSGRTVFAPIVHATVRDAGPAAPGVDKPVEE